MKIKVTKKVHTSFILGVFPVTSESWLKEKMQSIIRVGKDNFNFDFYSLGVGSEEAGDLIKNIKYLKIPENKKIRIIIGFYKAIRHALADYRTVYRFFADKNYTLKEKVYTQIFYLDFYYNCLKKSDIIHCHFGMIGNKFLMIERVIGTKAKIIVSFYGQDVEKYPAQRGPEYYKYMKERADTIFAMTDFMKSKLVEIGFSSDKIKVMKSGVDVDRYKFKKKIFANGYVFKIVSLGRIVEKKGFDDLLRAVKIVHDEYPKINVKILGGASEAKQYLENELLDLRKELGLEKVVEFCGMVKHNKIQEYFDDAHLMVQLSKTDKEKDTEGLPFVILEGQSAGLPIVSTRHAGIPEGVQDGVSGFLVDEGDYVSAAKKILHFIKNDQEVSKFSLGARSLIKDKFDITEKSAEIIKYYKS